MDFETLVNNTLSVLQLLIDLHNLGKLSREDLIRHSEVKMNFLKDNVKSISCLETKTDVEVTLCKLNELIQ